MAMRLRSLSLDAATLLFNSDFINSLQVRASEASVDGRRAISNPKANPKGG
jgi:hypothetical protein